MKKYSRSFVFAATVTVAMSFSLIACDDSSSANSNSTNNEAPVAPTDSVESGVSVDSLLIQSCASLAPSVPCADTINTDGKYYKRDLCYFKCENNAWKGVTKVPSDVTFYSYSELESMTQNQLPKCTAEKEGMVKRMWKGNPKYGSAWTYRCENGEWVTRDLWVTCDTTGVQVGDICRKDDVVGSFAAGGGAKAPVELYVYAGDGNWDDYDPRTGITKECTETNEGDVASVVFDVIPDKRDTVWYNDVPWNIFEETLGKTDTVSYECLNGEWSNFKITD